MNSKKTVMQLANEVIRYLNACADEDFVEGVLDRINDGVEFGEDEIGEVSDGNFENCFPAADGSRCAGQFGGKYRQQGGLGYQFAMAGRVPAVYCADSAKYELREG